MLETRASELERALLGMGEVDSATGAAPTGAAGRTEALINRGRPSARHGRRPRVVGFRPANPHGSLGAKRTRTEAARPQPGRRSFILMHWRGLLAAAAAFAASVVIAADVLSHGGPGWPPSVAGVRPEVTIACQNPDVPSEPGLVNFACGEDTQQILWVFALLTSGNNPSYVDKTTGRRGLEPIQPIQGGNIAWSVNLHHPYNPSNATDSITVAARAINNIVGGATLTSDKGTPSVQPGLVSSAVNCKRYTGSAALRAKSGYPAACARPIRAAAGRQALVTDVFRKWMPGASAATAADAGVLFTHADDPGNPKVQAILAKLPGFGLVSG